MISHPSRLTFWRLLLALTSPLAWISVWEAFGLAEKLGLSPLASKTWLVLLAALAFTGGISLFLLIFSFLPPAATKTPPGDLPKTFEIVITLADRLLRTLSRIRWIAYPLLLVALAAYPLIMFQPYYGGLLSSQVGIRVFLFWMLALPGMLALKLAHPRLTWFFALLITLLLQASLQQVMLYLPDISAYPFAMGWSETSRFYWPSLFVSRMVYGHALAWPILHPTLHFVLIPPYLLDAPLWFHRFWQVTVRFFLVGLIAPALIYRLKIETRGLRWLTGIWIFLTLFTLPLYLHLAVPVFIVLWGFSARNDRRTWFWLVLASIWAGLSRLNWYPVPGMLATALYFLEVPAENKGRVYLLKPILWFLVGTGLAFLSMQVYIALSGIPNPGDFYTSLSSTKLWDRLWPNESYFLGVVPGIAIYSAPFWLVLFSGWRQMHTRTKYISRFVWAVLLTELLTLFLGGVVVSTKIGGGGDIHNMDAYAVLLLVISTYLLFGARHDSSLNLQVSSSSSGPGPRSTPFSFWTRLHWSVLAIIILVPAWFSVQNTAQFWQYDPAGSQATLAALQQTVDRVNARGGQILFITQRQLISMHMLKGVTLIPEYEREELMEMAMANNEAYLQTFRTDLENHRFAAIVVDPLRFNLAGEQDAMGAENNAWTRSVAKKILCNYRQAAIFPADRIAIYVPQVGDQKCP